ncbi:MAG: hypothetical protein AAGH65_00380 [Pseudomonadota bacterium]
MQVTQGGFIKAVHFGDCAVQIRQAKGFQLLHTGWLPFEQREVAFIQAGIALDKRFRVAVLIAFAFTVLEKTWPVPDSRHQDSSFWRMPSALRRRA